MNPSQAGSTQEQAVIRKVALRLIPFLCLLYFVAFLDRGGQAMPSDATPRNNLLRKSSGCP